jgi:hypothetical protein
MWPKMPHHGDGPSATQARYLEHLGDRDLALLADAAGISGAGDGSAVRRMRGEPDLLERVLFDARTFERLFHDRNAGDPLLVASPFVVFSVSVHRAAADLEHATFVPDWVAPRQRVPVMDTDRLRDFVGDRQHRLFLAELLASYTKVASGALWVQSRKGWRRQRFSELDPVRLAALIDVVRSEERPGIYRRLGDLALFLTGVFPDHSSSQPLGRIDVQRLLRSGATEGATPQTFESHGALGFLELLGGRWYKLACATAPATPALDVVASVADRFRDARRVLNFITDRYLFRQRTRWFPGLAP